MKSSLVILALVSSVLTATTANAGLVSKWSVGVNAIFDTSTVVWDLRLSDGPGVGPYDVVSNTSLRWGTGTPNSDEQSGLDITNPAGATTVDTNGPAVPNVSVTHFNQPIVAPSIHLDSVDLISTLTLKPLVPDQPELGSFDLTFTIHFQETPNADSPCQNGLPGSDPLNANGCGDIFVIGQDALNFEFFYDTDGAGGDDPMKYYISFFEQTNRLNPLPAAACSSYNTDRWSPQSGLRPSAWRFASASGPKFLGRLWWSRITSCRQPSQVGHQANIFLTCPIASASASMSSRVLYIANDARAVAGMP